MEIRTPNGSSEKPGISLLAAASAGAGDERATLPSKGGAVHAKVVTLDQMRAALFPAMKFQR